MRREKGLQWCPRTLACIKLFALIFLRSLNSDVCKKISFNPELLKYKAFLPTFGGMLQTAVFTLFGIHSTKYALIFVWYCSIWSSTSFMDIWPLKMAATVRYRPKSGLQAAIMLPGWNIWGTNEQKLKRVFQFPTVFHIQKHRDKLEIFRGNTKTHTQAHAGTRTYPGPWETHAQCQNGHAGALSPNQLKNL